MPRRKSPYGVSPTKVSKVGELTNVLDDLLKQTKAKVLHLEANRSKLSEKLIGLWKIIVYLH
jgi:TPP-dependent trihydroxycyclohexane-1,2-dione (THcHDO) dehydratase